MKQGNAKSIRAILKNIATKESIDFQVIMTRFFHERLLYRIANSIYSTNFCLKGGALLYAIEGIHVRPTVDIDMQARQISNDRKMVENIFKTICSIKYEDDCVVFDLNSIQTSDIAKDEKYSGVRVFVETRLDTIRQRLQVDIGFGDLISPASVFISYPTLIVGLKPPNIMAYSVENVIAEKFHAMVVLGDFNSRMKDFYDIHILLENNKIKSKELQEAISQTLKQRNVDFSSNYPLFAESFSKDPNRQMMWKAFLRKIKHPYDLDFTVVVKSIVERLHPIYINLVNNKTEFN